ncbi:MAG: MBL fold metallo-hydrolase [Ruminococcus sp.]|nr:MBL fold metallo-hydrolase [Ruminococcus sp.]
MAKIVPLFSGSNGNSYYIGSSGEGVLIDAGRSCKQLENALELNDITVSSIGAIFVTHEHSDHCSGLRVFAKKHNIKIYASKGTLEAMEEKKYISPENFCDVIEEKIAVGNMQIVRCDTPHDAKESCCFQVTTPDGRKATVATDMGVMTENVRELICSSNLAVVESNHDIKMLKYGCYPPNVKSRILSDRGHLCNDACAEELADFIRCGNYRIMLGHISENNNTPELALNTSLSILSECGMKRNLDFTLDTVPSETQGKSIVF